MEPTPSRSGAGLTPAEALVRLRAAQDRDGGLTVAQRKHALVRLRRALRDGAEALAAAVDADFGGRPRAEILLTEVALVLAAIDHAKPRLARWARPERVSVGWRFLPARARVLKVPRGVVGILGPWNYPVQLLLLPVVNALAAGCRCLVKPSERAPATAQAIAALLDGALGSDVVAVVTGGPEVAAEVTRLPLDGLLFTGSTQLGREVMRAAAAGPVPVTLELGGKSPAIVDSSADLAAAARDIIAGKLLNAGQTCVAPDYVLVPRPRRDALVDTLRDAARALHPDPGRPDYGAVLGEPARARLSALQDGLACVPLFEPPLRPPRMTPVLVLDPPLGSALMREEIFGPVLPILTYAEIDEAIAVVRGLPPPLALYWFGRDRAVLDRVLERTTSGSVAVNDTVVHVGVEALPFGGVGASGIGAYHGRAGFETFTQRRPVFEQSRFSVTRLLRPPYGARKRRILDLLLR